MGTQSGIIVNGFVAHINFTSSSSTDTYPGYTNDTGLAYGNRGNLSFGWNQDNTANGRDRNSSLSPDERYDSLNQMQRPNNPNASWQIAVPNGTYTVHLVSGDPSFINSVYVVNVNGVLTVNGTPTSSQRWIEGTVSVTVTNGFITVTNATGSSNNKVDYIDVTQTAAPMLRANKSGAQRPGQAVVRWLQDHGGRDNWGATLALASGSASSRPAGQTVVISATLVAQQQDSGTTITSSAARMADSSSAARVADAFFGVHMKSLVESLQAPRHSQAPADWFTDSWLVDA
jgi:hypothetical protein